AEPISSVPTNARTARPSTRPSNDPRKLILFPYFFDHSCCNTLPGVSCALGPQQSRQFLIQQLFTWPGQRLGRLVAPFQVCFVRWDVPRPGVSIPGHADKVVPPKLLSLELIFDEYLAGKVNDECLAQVETRQQHRLLDPLQPGQLESGLDAPRGRLFRVFEFLAASFDAKMAFGAGRKADWLRPPFPPLDLNPLRRLPGRLHRRIDAVAQDRTILL